MFDTVRGGAEPENAHLDGKGNNRSNPVRLGRKFLGRSGKSLPLRPAPDCVYHISISAAPAVRR